MKEQRRIIFISHASPEDNQFCRWLSLQLIRRGYDTWCDVTKLLGGEKWWEDIDKAIRVSACKFVLVGSQTSIKKAGVIRELKIAQEIAPTAPHFIVPIRLDAVAYKEFPENIGSELNAIDFSKGWAPGLNQFLKRLEEDGTPKSKNLNPSIVCDYWRNSFPSQEGVNPGGEDHFSNWFPISSLPKKLWIHSSAGFADNGFKVDTIKYPSEKHGDRLLTFLPPKELKQALAHSGMRLRSSEEVSLTAFLETGSPDHEIYRYAAGNLLRSMLRKAWNANAISHGFQTYQLAKGARETSAVTDGLTTSQMVG
jgi:hypothetical protein